MNLNSNFTFDNFSVKDSNRLAFKVSKEVAENPGKLYNPLFIYGKSGCGKTHLLSAINNYIKENDCKKKILFIDCSEFINDFNNLQNHLDNNKLVKDFNNKYYNADVLLIDNIQYLVNDERAQLEFFNIFKKLYFREENSQFVLTADKELEYLGFIDYIMKKIKCYSLSVKIYITLPRLLDYDKQILDVIKKEVATYYDIPLEYLDHSIKGNRDKKNVIKARQMAICLSIKLTNINKTIISNSFGMYDHDDFSGRACIVHLYNNMAELVYKNPELTTLCQKKINEEIEKIRKSVDIVDVIKKVIPLEKRGKNYFGMCPFHKDTLPSFSVSQEKQIYKCFSCGASGNVITFVKKYEEVKTNEKFEKYFGSD